MTNEERRIESIRQVKLDLMAQEMEAIDPVARYEAEEIQAYKDAGVDRDAIG